MKIKILELEKKVIKLLLSEYTPKETELIKDVLMYGELSGKPSHGILRLIKENYGVFTNRKRTKSEYDRKTKLSTIISGNNNPGMLVGPLGLKECIDIAKNMSIGVVGTKGSINSTGSLAYYAEKIAENNFIGIVMAQSSSSIAPFNIKTALFGTNPIAFGIPSTPHPFVFDMSTSAIPFGKIASAKAANEKIPINTAIDSNGNITTNPSEALKGATLPFDNSFKGSGLAMVVEILAALWTGAGFAGNNEEDGWGNLFIALDPSLLGSTEILKERMLTLISTLNHAETRDGVTIRIPGENARKIRETNLRAGEVEISDDIYNKLFAETYV